MCGIITDDELHSLTRRARTQCAGAGFDIVDSFHSPLGNPSYSTATHVDTAYGGGGGTGYFSPNGVFAGGELSAGLVGRESFLSRLRVVPRIRPSLMTPRAVPRIRASLMVAETYRGERFCVVPSCSARDQTCMLYKPYLWIVKALVADGPRFLIIGSTPIADGTSPASYGTLPPYSDFYDTAY